VNVKNERRHRIDAINLGSDLFPSYVFDLFFEVGGRPIAAEVDFSEVLCYVFCCGHFF